MVYFGAMAQVELILQTKLQPPRTKGKILRRDRLLNYLKDNLDNKLILICADAGYGKTTLLAQLCEDLQEPYVFYDLDAKDNDITTFFSYLTNGIRKHIPHFGERVMSTLSQTRDIEVVVGTFINEFIENIKGDFYIILDDYHHLQYNRKIAQALDYFLRHLPTNLHFIISSRSTPPINVSYYATKQELFKIEKEQLRFDTEEIHALLKDVYGLRIPPTEIARIAELSEGWITVLQLILQKICRSGEETAQETLNRYISSDEDIFNYFAREVFEHQPKTIQDFLMKTSILEYLNPKICNYLLNIRRSQKIISRLETEHIFISKTGDNFKYHHVFQEFLFERLKSSFPSRVIRTLHYKTGSHFLAAGSYSLGVKHFICAESYSKAANILWKKYHHWIKQAEFAAYVQLVDLFPDSVIENYPYLLLKKSFALIGLERAPQTQKFIDSALKKFRITNDTSGLAEALTLKGQVYFAQMQPRKALYYIKKAYKLIWRKDSKQKADILMRMASVYRELGWFEKSRLNLEEALKILQKYKDRQLEESLLRRLALLHFTMSHFKEADKLFMEIFSKFGDQICDLSFAYMYGNVAAIAIDDGNVSKALEYHTRAENIGHRYNDTWLSNYLIYLKGEIYAFLNDYQTAVELFNKALNLSKEGLKILDTYILIEMIDMYVRIGKINQARDALVKLGPLIPLLQETPQMYILYQRVKGKLETAEGKFAQALDSFNHGLRSAKRIHQVYQSMRIYYELSRHYLAREEIQHALSYFRKCLTIARKHAYDGFITMEARGDIKLFQQALDNNLMPEYILYIIEKTESEEADDILKQVSIKRGVYDLACSFFGTLQVKDGLGQVIRPSWRTNKTKALFIFLVTNHQKGYTRDQLIDTFWPHKGAREAAHSLQVEISSLRRLLKAILKSDLDTKNVILYKNKNYVINPRFSIMTDVQEFEDLMKKAEASELTFKSQSNELYLRALELYRGDFCSDMMDGWFDEMRLYYRELVMKTLKKLGTMYYENSKYKKSLEYFREASKINQYDESIHLGLMRCYAALKDRDSVQKQYQILVKVLKKVGVSHPSPETLHIYQESLK